jgi:ribosomal protein S18 acetylase RimI-like enzyme
MPEPLQVELCHTDARFFALAGECLAAFPADHALIEDVLARGRGGPGRDDRAFHLLVVRQEKKALGFAVFALPRTVFLSVMHWSAATALAADMARRGMIVPTLIGAEPGVDAFASSWTEATGRQFWCRHNLVLYETSIVIEPPAVDGALRCAEPSELNTLVQWQEAFVRETKVSDDLRLVRRRVAEKLEDKRLYVWDSDGPKACAAHSLKRLGGARLYGVYTPPEWRRQGYGRGMIAQLTQRLLDSGHERCVLFADAQNTASNHLYKRLGYRACAQWKQLEQEEDGPSPD